MENPTINGHKLEPKLEVPTIYKAYVSGLFLREYPHNSYDTRVMVHAAMPLPSAAT